MMKTAKKLIQRWVLRIEVAGAAVTAYLVSDPNVMTAAWQAFPAVLKAHMTPTQVALVGVFIQVVGFVVTAKRNKNNESNKGDGNA